MEELCIQLVLEGVYQLYQVVLMISLIHGDRSYMFT